MERKRRWMSFHYMTWHESVSSRKVLLAGCSLVQIAFQFSRPETEKARIALVGYGVKSDILMIKSES